jgi:Ran GTPase-activating protein (RanGAP) involved in mRNA processing and transport
MNRLTSSSGSKHVVRIPHHKQSISISAEPLSGIDANSHSTRPQFKFPINVNNIPPEKQQTLAGYACSSTIPTHPSEIADIAFYCMEHGEDEALCYLFREDGGNVSSLDLGSYGIHIDATHINTLNRVLNSAKNSHDFHINLRKLKLDPGKVEYREGNRENVETYIEAIADFLKNNNTLTSLTLTRNSMGDEGAKIIANALRENRTLISLHLDRNRIGDEGIKEIADALKHNPILTSIDLSWNFIGSKGAQAVINASQNNGSLTSINLNANNIGYENPQEIVAALSDNHTLTSLDMGTNNLGDKGTYAIASALENNDTLTELKLYANNIGSEGAEKLANALQHKHTLKVLNLNTNLINHNGAQAIANTLNTLKLTSLHLSMNNIGDEGACAIAHNLKDNNTLTLLNLSANDINNTGTQEIAIALGENKTLKLLDLNVNDIGRKGIHAIARNIQHNDTLISINHDWDNVIDDTDAETITNKLRDNLLKQTLWLASGGSVIAAKPDGTIEKTPDGKEKVVDLPPLSEEIRKKIFRELSNEDIEKLMRAMPSEK